MRNDFGLDIYLEYDEYEEYDYDYDDYYYDDYYYDDYYYDDYYYDDYRHGDYEIVFEYDDYEYEYRDYDYIGGYNNGRSYRPSHNFGGYYSNNSYSASRNYYAGTFYDVGTRSGYLQNYRSESSVMNFVNANISSFSRYDSYVDFRMANGTYFQAQVSSSENEIFQYSVDGQNVSYAKLGYNDRANNFTYEEGVNFYSGGSYSNVLNVTSYESVTVHLDGSAGVLYNNINKIDASTSRGNNELFGNSGNNEIRAGKGNDALWGGNGGNDNLFGGEGQNTFFYGVHEGNDTIYNSVSTDRVNLYNISLTDIVSAGEVGQDFVIGMASGESLTIKGQNGASNFVLSDSSAYSYSRASHSWTKTA
ncbi:MAG: hypothetical protein IJS81_10445 [Selenomonadaceae bacterium]|nr:hypothetical protein [Selenomonadaceae bacterium]